MSKEIKLFEDDLGQEHNKKLEKVIMKAQKDDKYRRRLKAEPTIVLKEEGVQIPEGVEVRVREFDYNCRYLFLPPKDVDIEEEAKLGSE